MCASCPATLAFTTVHSAELSIGTAGCGSRSAVRENACSIVSKISEQLRFLGRDIVESLQQPFAGGIPLPFLREQGHVIGWPSLRGIVLGLVAKCTKQCRWQVQAFVARKMVDLGSPRIDLDEVSLQRAALDRK